MNLHNKTVLFIDLDNTLIKTISGKTFPEDITDFRIQLPVLDKIIEKLPNLEYFFIVTNQGGLDTFVGRNEFEAKLYSIEYFCRDYLSSNLSNFYGCASYYCDSLDKENKYRKPNTGMLEAAIKEHWRCNNVNNYIMIGDASGKEGDFSNSDKKCAENFGIDYIDVRDFLNL